MFLVERRGGFLWEPYGFYLSLFWLSFMQAQKRR